MLFFGALALPLAALFLIRRQRQAQQSAYLHLWLETLRTEGASARWQLEWLRLAWQLLILALWSLALAGPQTGRRDGAHRQLLVIDNSASMQHGERLAQAVAAAQRWVRPQTHTTIVVTAPTPRILVRDAGPELAQRMLSQIVALDAPGDFAELDGFLAAQRSRFAERVLYSDGCGAGLARLRPRLSTGWDWVQPRPTETSNRALREVRIVPLRDRRGWRVSATLANHGPRAVTAVVQLGEQSQRVSVAAGSERPIEFTLIGGRAGSLQLRLVGSDAFALDDSARIELPALPRSAVTLVSRNQPSPFWRSALIALGEWIDRDASRTVISREWPPAEALSSTGGFEVLILDGVRLRGRKLPPGRYILFGIQGAGLPAAGKPRRNIGVWQTHRRHPVMRHVSLTELLVRRGRPLVVRDGAGPVALARSSDGALIVAERRGDTAFVSFAFELADSNLAGLIAFPLLLKNILLWLAAQQGQVRVISFEHPHESRLALPGGASSAVPKAIAPPVRRYQATLGWISLALLLLGLLLPPVWATRR